MNTKILTLLISLLSLSLIGQNVGIGTTNPSEKLELKNGSILLSGLGNTNEKGLLLGESDIPIYGWIYDGIGFGNDNQLVLREYLGSPSDIMTVKGNGSIILNQLTSNSKKPLLIKEDGEITTDSEVHNYNGRAKNPRTTFYDVLRLPEGVRMNSVQIKYRDRSSSKEIEFYLTKTSFADPSFSIKNRFFNSGISTSSPSSQTATLLIPNDFGLISNDDFIYYINVLVENDPSTPNDLWFQAYKLEYEYE